MKTIIICSVLLVANFICGIWNMIIVYNNVNVFNLIVASFNFLVTGALAFALFIECVYYRTKRKIERYESV